MAKFNDIALDRWNFCNGIVHGGDRPAQQLHYHCLNCTINSKFGQGSEGLMPDSQWLLTDRPVSDIKAYNIVTKVHWVKTVHAARQAYAYVNTDQCFRYFSPFCQGLHY